MYREQEIDFLTKTYNQMEGLQVELEQCKQRNRELENTLAQANEEQEALAAQLYETGHALDETNNEVRSTWLTRPSIGRALYHYRHYVYRCNVKRMSWNI